MKPKYCYTEQETELDAVHDHLDEITDIELLKELRDDIDRRIRARIMEGHISDIRGAIHDAHQDGLTVQFVNCDTLETFTVENSNYCILLQ